MYLCVVCVVFAVHNAHIELAQMYMLSIYSTCIMYTTHSPVRSTHADIPRIRTTRDDHDDDDGTIEAQRRIQMRAFMRARARALLL